MCFRPSAAELKHRCEECGYANEPEATECVGCGRELEPMTFEYAAPGQAAPGQPASAAPGTPSAPGAPSAPVAPGVPAN